MFNIIAKAISSIHHIPASEELLFSVTIIIVVAAIFAFISKALKQQLILAYIATGIIIGPLVLGLIQNIALISSLAEIGIAFLLFTAGLEISASKIKEQTFPFLFAGIFEIFAVTIITFFIAIALHFRSVEALYLGLILAFSSTVLVVKILADKKELNTLHSRIAIGILLVQDIAAILALILLNQNSFYRIILVILQASLLILIAMLLNKTILNSLFRFASSSHELLFLAALAFVFFFAALAFALNLSIVIGSFIAGLALSNSPYKIEIESKIRPLRDFFVIIFLVSLGMLLTTFDFKTLFLPFIVFLAIIILLKPFIIALAIRLSNYKSRTSLSVGFSLGQLSEFSLVIAFIAVGANLITQTTFNLVVLLSIISMAATPYLMRIDNFLHKAYHSLFEIFKNVSERRDYLLKEHKIKKEKKTILLFGCHRIGSIFLKGLEKYKHKVLVIDFNPEVINALTKQNVSCIYGDALSSEVLETLNVQEAKVAISTIPKVEENIYLTKYLKSKNKNIFVVVSTEKIHDALKLYENGVDFVILPTVISGEIALKMIIKMTKKEFRKYKKEHIEYLKKIHRYLY
ncbi:MAG: cation:proton antiporter [Candidatus Pacearchaeota archaeon]